jgi:pSer/pThr/pTyr-binding forkhead associated (FHA) protein
MPKLVLKFRDSIIQEIPLSKELTTIGRVPDNDIVINNLGVSRLHAKIIRDGEDYYLEDMGSRNATFLNNQEVKKSKLKDNDEIGIGKHTLVFLLHAEVSPEAALTAASQKHVIPEQYMQGDETMQISPQLATKKYTARGITSPIEQVPTSGKKPTGTIEPVPMSGKKITSPIEQAPTPGRRITSRIEKAGLPGRSGSQESGVEILEGGVNQTTVKFERALVVAGKSPTVDIRIKGNYEKDVVFVISNRPTGFFISPPKGISLKVNGQDVKDHMPLNNGSIIQAAETKMKFFIH